MATTRLLGNIKGKDGAPAKMSFTTPVSLPTGSTPTVENLGTDTNPVLRIGIPRGDTGRAGADGQSIRGPQGEPGLEGQRGKAATIGIHGTTIVDTDEDVRVENMGSSSDASLHFFLKRTPDPLVIDETLVENSENPVQSKAIQSALAEKADVSSIPTKTSDLANDRSFVSSSTVNVMIEDALSNASSLANPVDTALSSTSTRALQNKVITSELAKKIEMEIEDILDNTGTMVGERLTFADGDRAISIALMGDQVLETTFLTQIVKNRDPVIVSSLPSTGEDTKLYLVPVQGSTYSMHLWMEVNGTMEYVAIGDNASDSVDLSGYAVKGDAIKNITRSGTTFTATRADGTTFTFDQQDNNTWVANSSTGAGYVASPSGVRNLLWRTDYNGNPTWMKIENIFTTFYAEGTVTFEANDIRRAVVVTPQAYEGYMPIIVSAAYVDNNALTIAGIEPVFNGRGIASVTVYVAKIADGLSVSNVRVMVWFLSVGN